MAEGRSSGSPSFAQMLRDLRSAARLTQEALAERSGVSVDAISALENGRRLRPHPGTATMLADGLGLDPNERERFVAVAQARRPADGLTPPRHGPAPRELPLPPADFIGRQAELTMLNEAAIAAIDGMAGVGKSALAIHAAHQLTDAGAFPDGQLYVDLQGDPPPEPLDVLARMLRSLGENPAELPHDLDEAAARFRSVTAGRKLLVLLDNVSGVDQVRPLLPGSPACRVIVTSRQVLAALPGARLIHLDVLSPEQALELLGRVAGRSRTLVEGRDSEQVAKLCGYLPLAIRIAGARLAARPSWPVRELARQLADTTQRLTALQVGELSVRASFDVSLHGLEDRSGALDRTMASGFALLSLLDGPDLSIPVAVRLLDQPEPAARTILERLVDARLLDTAQPGRYRFHDLIRIYARSYATQRLPEAARSAAITRAMGFYLATTWHTLSLLRPGDWRIGLADPRWSRDGLEFTDAVDALRWLETERDNLLAAIAQAAQLAPAIPAQVAAELTRALSGLFLTRSYWREKEQANRTILDLARREQNRAMEAAACHELGVALAELGRLADAVRRFEEGLSISRDMDDIRLEGAVLNSLGFTYSRLGLYGDAIRCVESSLEISRTYGDRRSRCVNLTNLGVAYGRMGRYREAVDHLLEGLPIARELDDRHSLAEGLVELGIVFGQLGRHSEAVACLEESLPISRQLGDRQTLAEGLCALGAIQGQLGRYDEAIACLDDGLALLRVLEVPRAQALALRDLGDVLFAAEGVQPARAIWEEALTISRTLGIPETDSIRSRLARFREAAAPGD